MTFHGWNTGSGKPGKPDRFTAEIVLLVVFCMVLVGLVVIAMHFIPVD